MPWENSNIRLLAPEQTPTRLVRAAQQARDTLRNAQTPEHKQQAAAQLEDAIKRLSEWIPEWELVEG